MPRLTEVALVTLITSGMKLYRQNIQRANATNRRAVKKWNIYYYRKKSEGRGIWKAWLPYKIP